MTAPVMAGGAWATNAELIRDAVVPLAAKLTIPALWGALRVAGCTLPGGSYADEIRAHAIAEHPHVVVAATVAELDRRMDVMQRLNVRAEAAEGRLRALTSAAQAVLDAVPAQGTLLPLHEVAAP